MKFELGCETYRVRISTEPLYYKGQPVAAMCADGAVVLCCTLPARERIDALLDHLRRLWERKYGKMISKGAADFATGVLRQLEHQGGEPALMGLTSEGWVDKGTVEDLAADQVGCQCARCGTKYTSQQIATSKPTLDAERGKMVVSRAVECEFCNVTMNWTEGVTPKGSPNGNVVTGPLFSRCSGVSLDPVLVACGE